MEWCTLLSNTPLREVIDSSPISDKIVYLVNIFPHYQKLLPQDMFEAWHRARDIIYTDKTDNNIRLSTIMSRHLSLLKEMHDLLMISCARFKVKGNDADFEYRFDKMELEYNKLARRRGCNNKGYRAPRKARKNAFPFRRCGLFSCHHKEIDRARRRGHRQGFGYKKLESMTEL